MDPIYLKYVQLAARFGVDLSIETLQDASAPPTRISEENGSFTIRLSPDRFLPNISCAEYLGACTRDILLPRLTLETERLILRRYRPEDAKACFAFLSDERGCYLDCCNAFQTMDDAFYDRLALFAQRESQYMVVLKASGTVIGTVHVFPDNSRAVESMELGYSISPAYRRKGYAYEALSALIRLLQQALTLDLLVAGVLEENTPSIRLLEKLGFRKEGLRRKAAWHEGLDRPVDLQYYYLDRTP